MKKGITYYPVKQLSDEWDKLREDRITASVAPACLGVSTYHSPQKACRMIWGTEPHVSNWYMDYGREHEQDACNAYESVTGNLTRQCGFYVNEQTPWIGASPDRIIVGGGTLEAKCSNKTYEVVPLQWIVQAKVQLHCSGEPWADIAHWQDGSISIARTNRDLIEEMILELEQFYNRFVRESCEPKRGEIKPWEKLVCQKPLSFVRYAC